MQAACLHLARLKNTVMRADAQSLVFHGTFQHALTVTAHVIMAPDLARSHLGNLAFWTMNYVRQWVAKDMAYAGELVRA